MIIGRIGNSPCRMTSYPERYGVRVCVVPDGGAMTCTAGLEEDARVGHFVRRGGSPNQPGRRAMDAAAFEDASRTLLDEHPGDERGRMLQSPGLKTSGALYAFATGSDLVVKLPAARVAELIDAGAGRPCEPRPGRPMRQWVRLTAADAELRLAYLAEAREFVTGLATR